MYDVWVGGGARPQAVVELVFEFPYGSINIVVLVSCLLCIWYKKCKF